MTASCAAGLSSATSAKVSEALSGAGLPVVVKAFTVLLLEIDVVPMEGKAKRVASLLKEGTFTLYRYLMETIEVLDPFTGYDIFKLACPSRRVLDRIADRWTALVLFALQDGTLRFSE